MSLLSDKPCLAAMTEADVFIKCVSLFFFFFVGVAKVDPSVNTASLFNLYSFWDKAVVGEHVGRTK